MNRFATWLPLALILCIPYLMGADGSEFLPAIYIVSNAIGGWLSAKNSIKMVRDELAAHVADASVHNKV